MRRVPAIDLSRSRDLGDVFGDTFSLYRRYFGLFAGIAVVVVIPMEVALYLVGDERPDSAVAVVATFVPWLVGVPLITAGHVRAVMTLGERRDAFAGDALRAALRRLPVVVGGLILAYFAALVGCLLLIVPGIILSVRLYFTPQAVMAEGLGAADGLGRSWELTRGNFWRLAGIGLLLAVTSSVMGGLIAAPLGIAGAAADSRLLAALGATVSDCVSLSFTALSGTLLYFDLRARHGGAPEPRIQYPEFPPNDLLLPERP